MSEPVRQLLLGVLLLEVCIEVSFIVVVEDVLLMAVQPEGLSCIVWCLSGLLYLGTGWGFLVFELLVPVVADLGLGAHEHIGGLDNDLTVRVPVILFFLAGVLATDVGVGGSVAR